MAEQEANIGIVAHVTIDGKAFLAHKVSYGCNRNTDERGSPTDAPKARLIRMSISPVQADDFVTLYDWAFKNDRKLSGQVEFRYDDDSQVLRKMEFEDAYCSGFRETFQYTRQKTRNEPEVHVPDPKTYKPENRDTAYFSQKTTANLVYELVLLPAKVKIGQVEINC